MTRENLSYWELTCGTRPEFAPLSGDGTCEVAIVGGGLTGITLAALLARQGVKTIVLEADRIGSGTTGKSTAKITVQHGLKLHRLIGGVGEEKARLYAEANRMGADQIADFVETLKIGCDHMRAPAHVFAETESEIKELEKEMRAMETLHVDGALADRCDLPFPVKAVLTTQNQAHFHPLKYLFALVQTLVQSGTCALHERSRAIALERGRRCLLRTRGGTVCADTVVLATNYPMVDMPGFYFSRLHQERSYIRCVDAQGLDIGGMYINAGKPVRSFRTHPGEGSTRLLAGGYGHKTGRQGDMDSYGDLQKLVENRFNGHMGLIAQWSAQDTVTLDNVPYVGTLSKEAPNVYIAAGYDKWGMTNATAAALMIASAITSAHHPVGNCAAAFDPHRFTPSASAKSFLVQNLDVIRQFTVGNLAIPFNSLNTLKKGEGRIMGVESDAAAAYRDEEGDIHVYNAHCTHMKCPLTYNQMENSFDCPCHGSRFGTDGEVLEGPALYPLEKKDAGEKD
ncbi:MAG: FAD-dependent oxidoreductase [Christensenellales bacterium]